MSVTYAVDLGTTYSKCAFVHPESGQVVVVPLGKPDAHPRSGPEEERAAILRSVVAFGGDSKTPFAVVGDRARALTSDPSYRIVEEAKGSIGESLRLDGNAADPPPWRVESHDWSYLPQEVGALVLRRIKQIVDRRYPEWPMQRVVITHPQRFEDPRREATRQAGRLAGLEVVGTITEPDAAAVCLGLEAKPGTYLVFDIGGGTLDVTVASLAAGSMTPLSASGDHVGGRTYDAIVFGLMVQRYADNFPGFTDNAFDHETRLDWVRMAEDIKTQLCDAVRAGDTSAFARREILCSSSLYEGGRLQFRLTADELRDATKHIDDLCRSVCEQAMSAAKVTPRELAGVVMVGGSSLNPWLQKMLRDAYGVEPLTELGPSTAIARGAAIFARSLATRSDAPGPAKPRAKKSHAAIAVDDAEIASVLPRGLGLKIWDSRRDADVIFPLVKANTRLPHQYERAFRTVDDGDTVIPIELYEGDSDDPTLCTKIGECELTGIPPGRPAGEKVTVRIDIDSAARKKIVARHLASGAQATAAIRYDPEKVVPEDDEGRLRKHLDGVEVRG